MTEDDAKKKWCPFVRAINGKIEGDTSAHESRATSYNRIVDGSAWSFPQGGACLGSACMAWRWGGKHSPPSLAAIKSEVDAGSGALDAVAELNRRNPPGFCGLAGVPQ